MYYPDQFTPATSIDRNEWRPSIIDLAVYGATGDAVDGISAPAREHREWVIGLIATSVYSVENAVTRAKQESRR